MENNVEFLLDRVTRHKFDDVFTFADNKHFNLNEA